ncbi:MAG: glycosyltransferase family 9 protein [Candidatus Acidiferrales bacterium]
MPSLCAAASPRHGEACSLLENLSLGSKILIVRLRSLGDLVLETPAIAAIHAWRPDLQIHILAEPRFAAVFEGNGCISKVILSAGFSETSRVLRRERFPVVFNQHGGPRSALLTLASGSKHRVGWKGFQFSFAYNLRVPDAQEFYGKPVVHAVEHRMSQFYWTGLPRGPLPNAQVFPQADAIERVGEILARGGIDRGAKYAVLQPGARLASMRWPAEKFAEIARWLRAECDIASVVNLSSADTEIASGIRNALRDCAVIPDPLSIRELIALIAGSRVLVGNDSGPVHLAAATGRPSVVIYGPTNPEQWHPWQTEYRPIHTDAVFDPKRGDKSLAVRESRSISSIETDEVRSACVELLRASGDVNMAGN